jgi:hypothetical protein
MLATETLRWTPVAHVDKWDQDQTDWVARRSGVLVPQAAQFEALGVRPYGEAESIGNLLTTAGLNRLTSLLIAAGGQALTATALRLGVGDGTGTAAVGDTDLGAAAGAAHRQFYVMDSTFPTQSNGVLTAKSSFASADANFAWNEWGLDVGAPTVANGTTVNALLFNHKTSAALGTKTTGTWALTVTVTIS